MIRFCHRVVEARAFERFIIGVILGGAVVVGLETSPEAVAIGGDALRVADDLVLAVFIVEAAMKLAAGGRGWYRYFANGWNVFDFAVIVAALLPGSGEFAAVARLVRILRVLRLISATPKLRLLVATLVRAIPGMGNVLLLMSILFYVYAVIGVHLFHDADPERWGGLGSALLVLFEIVTLEGWVEVMEKALESHPWAWVYFVSFVVIGTFVVINLFIAVVINSLEESREHELEALVAPPTQQALVEELRHAQAALSRLETRLRAMEADRPR